MKFSVNVAIQMLALVAQGLNASIDLLPGRGKFWAMVGCRRCMVSRPCSPISPTRTARPRRRLTSKSEGRSPHRALATGAADSLRKKSPHAHRGSGRADRSVNR